MEKKRILHSIATLLTVLPAIGAAGAPGYLGTQPVTPGGNIGALTATCGACHGAHGNSVLARYPNLAGQNYNYLLKQLQQFQSGARKAVPMNAMAAGIPSAGGDNLRAIAAWYAKLKPDRTQGANAADSKPTLQQARRGYRLYIAGVPATGAPACSACHMESGVGNAPMAIPALAGQHAAYLEQQLHRFASGTRDNSPQHIMHTIAARLTDSQIQDVALYLQQLRPARVQALTAGGYAARAAVGADTVPGVPAKALKSPAADGTGDPGNQTPAHGGAQ